MLRQNLLTAVALTSLLAVTPALAIPQDGAVQTRSTMSLASRNADGTAYEVRVEDGAVRSLKINGEDVPTDRARVTDTGVEVLDEDGEVIHRFAVRTSGMARAAGAAGAAATRAACSRCSEESPPPARSRDSRTRILGSGGSMCGISGNPCFHTHPAGKRRFRGSKRTTE